MRKNFYKVRNMALVLVATSCIAFTGCGGADKDSETTKESQEVKVVQLAAVRDAVKEAYGDEYVPDYEFDTEYISNTFGITEDMFDEIIAEGPTVAFDIDTFIAVKAKEGKAEAVANALTSYKDAMIQDAMTYPENAIKLQGATVTVKGDYVFFTCLGVISDESKDAGDDAMLEETKKDNQKAVDAINKCFE